MEEWGVDMSLDKRAGLLDKPVVEPAKREVFLLQRKKTKVGAGLGKTTGKKERQNDERSDLRKD